MYRMDRMTELIDYVFYDTDECWGCQGGFLSVKGANGQNISAVQIMPSYHRFDDTHIAIPSSWRVRASGSR